MRRFYPLALWLLFFVTLSCGKKGQIYPPIKKIPQKIENFKILQVGNKISLSWQNPSKYIDGNPIVGITKVGLWMFSQEKNAEGGYDPYEEIFINEAINFSEILPEQFIEQPGLKSFFEFESAEIGTRRYIFGVRVLEKKGNFSEFSKLLSIEPKAIALPPVNLTAVTKRNKIQIDWSPPSANIDQTIPPILGGYNIYRFQEKGEPLLINSKILTENKFDDKKFEFDNTYIYFVRTVSSESLPYLESTDSETVEVQAKDTFAPAAPKGLVAIAGRTFITLSWNLNLEKDLSGYKVWRKIVDSNNIKLLTKNEIQQNSYTDYEVEVEIRYEYEVSAYDDHGNESPKSKKILAVIQGESYENIPL